MNLSTGDDSQQLSYVHQVLHATPHELVSQTAQVGHRHLYIDGGRAIQAFLRAGLITELTITVIPMQISMASSQLL
ncbi:MULTISPECIES: dihydrofolate reductase family protein [unclassified Cyanobium]|uniref:dihydrofolate reductase family protein n=1 Tax=unclassified Cyanobium TaxID=2627006 RepID=UPI0020CF3DAB|nr:MULTISPECIES: dihydrofolate reductase family protein [unclassified Cyanobium]MCP9835647.1 hypothetical protein [Cyanobium sp. La Preciosa 7G6]MCP9938413.1 hypothetical protein [Cyanobium sp. Aljojuca 7A6]